VKEFFFPLLQVSGNLSVKVELVPKKEGIKSNCLGTTHSSSGVITHFENTMLNGIVVQQKVVREERYASVEKVEVLFGMPYPLLMEVLCHEVGW
jgi:hypothetical protein